MVQEQVAWFKEKGSTAAAVSIRVTAAAGRARPDRPSAVLPYDRPKRVALVTKPNDSAARSRPRAVPVASSATNRPNGQSKRGKRA